MDEFLEFSRPHFSPSGSGWTYTAIDGSRKISTFEDSFATFDELLLSKDFCCTARGSGTVVRKGSYWFIGAYHLSFPIPNGIARSLCGMIGEFEKTSAVSMAEKAAQDLIAELDFEDKQEFESGAKKAKSKAKKKK